jgi:hypothetical protein
LSSPPAKTNFDVSKLNGMKLLTSLSFHYLVYVGMAIIITTTKLVAPQMPSSCIKRAEVKTETVTAKGDTPVLHGDLLLRY